MAFRPNYNQQRNERRRAKEQKKQEKLDRREAEVARRRAERETPDDEAQGESGGDVEEEPSRHARGAPAAKS